MRQIEEIKGDIKVAQALETAWAEEDRAQEAAMMKRALAESEALAQAKANSNDDMYHPDEPKVTKDGFYLKDSDDSDPENQAYSSSDDEHSEEEDVHVNTGRK